MTKQRLGTEAVEGAPGTLEGVNDVQSRHGFPTEGGVRMAHNVNINAHQLASSHAQCT